MYPLNISGQTSPRQTAYGIAMTDYRKPDSLALPASSRRRFMGLCGALMAWLGQTGTGWATSRRSPAVPPDKPPTPGDFPKSLSHALRGQPWHASDGIRLEVPQLAENGAIVPIAVESLLPNTRRILVFAEKNPGPLLAEFHFEPGTDAWVSLRVKLNETGSVLAVAESEGHYYGMQTTVRVMVGGCG